MGPDFKWVGRVSTKYGTRYIQRGSNPLGFVTWSINDQDAPVVFSSEADAQKATQEFIDANHCGIALSPEMAFPGEDFDGEPERWRSVKNVEEGSFFYWERVGAGVRA